MSSISRRHYLSGTASVGSLLIAGCLGGDDDTDDADGSDTDDDGFEFGDYDEQISAGWAEEGGAGYTLGQIVATQLHEHSEFGMDVGATSGGANMRHLDEGDYDLGYTNAHVYTLAYDRKNPYDNPEIEQDIWQAFGIFDVTCFFIAREDSGVETLSDFEDANVTIYTPAASMHLAARDGLENVGVYEDMNERQYPVNDVPRPFETGEVDVAMAYNVVEEITPGWVQELTPQLDDDEFKFVQMTDEEADLMGVGGNTMVKHTPSGYYEDDGEPEIWAFRLGYNQHALPDFPDDLMYDFLQDLHDLSENFHEDSPLAARLGTQEGFELLLKDYPIHPGAAEFYQDQGWWNDEWTEGSR